MSMSDVIGEMIQKTEADGKKDTRPRYKGICPVCGKENWICKSIAMEIGINSGVGSCLGCGTFCHIVFNPERQEMELEEFEKYRDSVQARKDGDAIAGNMGYGGQDDDEQK